MLPLIRAIACCRCRIRSCSLTLLFRVFLLDMLPQSIQLLEDAITIWTRFVFISLISRLVSALIAHSCGAGSINMPTSLRRSLRAHTYKASLCLAALLTRRPSCLVLPFRLELLLLLLHRSTSLASRRRGSSPLLHHRSADVRPTERVSCLAGMREKDARA